LFCCWLGVAKIIEIVSMPRPRLGHERGGELIPRQGAVRGRPLRVVSNFFILERFGRGFTNYATR